jgi:methyl-accepting chemotaxis protein
LIQKLPNKSNNKIDHFDNDLPQTINFEEIVANLKLITEQLTRITENSEQNFLEIGSKLQKYLTCSRELSKFSSNAATVNSNENLNKSISELTFLLKKISKHFLNSSEEVKTDKEELLHVLKEVEVIVDELSGFKKVVKQLRMLGVSTKIESSRLGNDEYGFYALAENVDKLSTLINDKVASIIGKISLLSTEIKRATTDLQKLEIEQRQQSVIILNHATLSLETLEKKYNLTSQKTESISYSSQNVNQNINEIVTSIQFHDITRQQIEHVSEVITELSEKSNTNLCENNSPKIADEFAFVHDVCELQSIQLKNSIDEFELAVLNIISNLKKVEKNITEIFDDSCELLNERDAEEEGDSLWLVRNELTTISNGIIRNDEVGNDLAKSTMSVVGMVHDLSEDIGEIEDIGTEIEMIALNAIIKAAHTGSNGLALGILAESIQKLSLDAKSYCGNASKFLVRIAESSKSLSVNMQSATGDEESLSIISTNKKIDEMINSMMNTEQATMELMVKFKTDILDLRNEIKSTTEGITIHQTTRHSINQVLEILKSITGELQSKGNFNPDRERNTKDLFNKYTMHSERNIHHKFTVGENYTTNPNPSFGSEKDIDGLGDNVELF